MAEILPFTQEQAEKIAKVFGTPVYVYDERGIRDTAKRLNSAFSWVEEVSGKPFMNYFAVKALPNPKILEILAQEGMGADASSAPELMLAQMANISGQNIMFTSNATPMDEYRLARSRGAILNLDDISHIKKIHLEMGLPGLLSFRYNPGGLTEGNGIIGKPEEAKYGLTREQLFEAYAMARYYGVQRFGLHTMVVSNERDEKSLIGTAEMMFSLAAELLQQMGISLDFINLGGGIGIPYRPEDEAVDLLAVSSGIREAYMSLLPENMRPQIVMENGRYVTGPHGFLLTRVRHFKHTYRDYAQVDATMADLMRPGLYGAYHHITVLGKEDAPLTHTYDVVGSLCENNDKFAIQRQLPELAEGNLLVFHDAGAHGRAMGFNYNGKLRCGEALLRTDSIAELIRRHETIDDYVATLRFEPKSIRLS